LREFFKNKQVEEQQNNVVQGVVFFGVNGQKDGLLFRTRE
jgi:hypothetical protein